MDFFGDSVNFLHLKYKDEKIRALKCEALFEFGITYYHYILTFGFSARSNVN